MLKKIRQEFAEGKTFLQFGILKAAGQTLAMIALLVKAKYILPERIIIIADKRKKERAYLS
jgi:hypothetical protein